MARLVIVLFVFLSGIFAAYADEVNIIKTYGISLTKDRPKYGADFKHFDYADPAAPKGGTMRLGYVGSYDSFNPVALKGVVARGGGYFSGFLYDTLLTPAYDESSTYYGLLAETMEYPSDYSWVIFNLRPEAKWHDGKPVTAEDVVYTFNKITEVNPYYRNYYNLVTKAEAIGKNRVKFTFKEGESSMEMPLIIGQMAVLPKHYWEKKDMGKASTEIPLSSGPYKIESYELGKNVTFKRVEDYWGKDLPVNVGHNNFDRIVTEYLRDITVTVEAFKAGHFDFIAESSGIRWQRGYTGKYFDMGLIVKREVPMDTNAGMAGVVFNTDVAPFDNILVRKAFAYAYDFEWINKNLYFGQDKRHYSFFSNSELACEPVPTPEVAAIIKSVKPGATKEELEAPFALPITKGDGNNRENLMQAVKLLEDAGYKLTNGKMVDKSGKQLQATVLTASRTIESELLTFQKSLERIGIAFNVQYIDSTLYIDKVRNKDYTMIYSHVLQSDSPGNEQRDMWHSEAANEIGSSNYAKIKDPAIDALIDKIINAKDRKSLVNYTKALDRLLLNGWYFIPSGYAGKYRIAYWDKFGFPDAVPSHGLDITTWWIIPEKEKKLDSLINK